MLDVAIVGGGPVGLCLASLLAAHGITVAVFEQRPSNGTHTRAIGIHPPGLAVLDTIGAAEPLLARGIRIQHGRAIAQGRTVAGIDFALADPTRPYVLAVPQPVTQSVLEERLEQLAPGALHRGSRITAAHSYADEARLTGTVGGKTLAVRSRFLVGADGARSTVRRQLGIPTRAFSYPDHYLMGDFPADGLGEDTALLYLSSDGIVESFPLPHGIRRWVARMPGPVAQPSADHLAGIIEARTGVVVSAGEHSMLSSFGVRAQLAGSMVQGRAALIGDAAHEISPIGGLGMNLGWLDAAALAPIIATALAGGTVGAQLDVFERSRMAAARRAMGHSALNMTLGRPAPETVLRARNSLIGAVLRHPAAQTAVAKRFTMTQH